MAHKHALGHGPPGSARSGAHPTDSSDSGPGNAPARHARRAVRTGQRVARRRAIYLTFTAVLVLAGAGVAVFLAATGPGTAVERASGGVHAAADPPAVPAPRAPAGSAPVGDTDYPVPAGALFVAPGGSDSAGGTKSAPLRTIGRAVARAPAGDTIVLRQGTYHESVSIRKKLTIQSYPHETVWLDGSARITGWAKSGSRWVKHDWSHVFDHSPTYTRGAPDGTKVGWQWINPKYPMAAHPDQLWASGVPLRQVATLDQVRPGSFYVDDAHHRLYLGTNPATHEVRASTIGKAITVQAAGSTIRGIGIRRYAPAVPQMGAVILERPSIVVQDVVISDTATTGLFAGADNVTLRDITVKRSGLLGIGANEAYGIRLIGVDSSDNNVEHFNTAPVSGGFKITRSRGILIQDSEFDHNRGPGVWLDESTYDSRIVGNRIIGNSVHGLSLEISAKSVVADNLFLRNGGDGVKVNNTGNVQIWNNTFLQVGRSLDLVQDARQPSSSYAHDQRRPFPDPTMTWRLGPVTVGNNVIGEQNSTADCMLCTEDHTHARSAATAGIAANGDVYNRPRIQPSWTILWSQGSGDSHAYDTVRQFHAATGQESTGRLYDGSAVVRPNGVLTAAVAAEQGRIAQPLPHAVAVASGHATGSRHLGSWTY